MRQAALRALPLCAGLLCVFLLWRELSAVTWADVVQALQTIPAWRWAAAFGAAGISYWAMARYDVIAHRHLDTGVDPGTAMRTGAAALALGQAIGFGPVVGAAVRFRMLGALPKPVVLRLTVFVTTCFAVLGLAITGSLAVPLLLGKAWISALVVPVLCLAGAILVICYPRLRILGWRLDLPSLPATGRLGALCLTDLIAMSAALWLLIPPETAPAFGPLFGAFCLALWAGYLGGTPGGIGPFEMTLLALLPAIGAEPMAAGCLAFRLVYHLGPGLIAASVVLLARQQDIAATVRPPAPLQGARAEQPIAAQSPHAGIAAAGSEAAVLLRPQTAMLFLGASRGALLPLLPALQRLARTGNRIPCLYKITNRDAVRLRRAGWKVVVFARDAVVPPGRFSLSGADKRQLRRMLRRAEDAGVAIRRLSDADLPAMDRVHESWLARHGTERGLTMGRYCPAYLADKVSLGAFVDGRLVAFVSLVAGQKGMAVDLMRSGTEAPAGSMHALVLAALDVALQAKAPELSLAALPHGPLARLSPDGGGLIRFKTAFAPRWRPLYVAAPGWVALVIALADIALGIRKPAPLPQQDLSHWLRATGAAAAPVRDSEPLQRAG